MLKLELERGQFPVLLHFGLLGNLKGFDLVAGGRARQRCPRLERHTGQDAERGQILRANVTLSRVRTHVLSRSVGVAKARPRLLNSIPSGLDTPGFCR